MKRYIFSTVILLNFLCGFVSSASAQNCPKYEKAMKEGKALLEKKVPDFDQALLKFQAAQIAARECGLTTKAPASQLEKVFAGLKQQRDDAVRAENLAKRKTIEAQRALKKADSLLTQVQIEKSKTEIALQQADALNNKNEKLIRAFYFYNDKFALASRYDEYYGGYKFGFINKEGDVVIDYRYDEAQQFDHTGFAKVKTIEDTPIANTKDAKLIIDYLLDTLGQTYEVAYRLEDFRKAENTHDIFSSFNQQYAAVDLREATFQTFPTEIFQLNLKVGILSDKQSRKFGSVPSEIGRLNGLTHLFMPRSGITALPPSIGNLMRLKVLDLEGNKLQTLPPEFNYLQNLRYLNLGGNDSLSLENIVQTFQNFDSPALIANTPYTNLLPKSFNGFFLIVPRDHTLPQNIGGFTHLKGIVFSDVENFTAFPESMTLLEELEFISVTSCMLEELPKDIERLNKLQYLILDYNRVDSFPEGFSKLSNLVELTMSTNFITYLPRDIGNLSQLNYIDFRDNAIGALPASLGQLKSLRHLDLNRNEFEEFPNALLPLANLEYLNLGNNDIRVIPTGIEGLKNLKEFVCNYCALNSISSSIGQLRNLHTLSLDHNPLTRLPESIGDLQNLVLLDLGNNMLESIPEKMGNLTQLELLNLSLNKIPFLPNSIGRLENLGHLSVSYNELTELPPSIVSLKNLRVLDLDLNKINTLPDEIGNLLKLVTLSANNNKITSIPLSIGNLVNLKLLDLSNNRITHLPVKELGKLKQLNRLNIQGNKIPENEITQLKALLPNCMILH